MFCTFSPIAHLVCIVLQRTRTRGTVENIGLVRSAHLTNCCSRVECARNELSDARHECASKLRVLEPFRQATLLRLL